MPVWITIDIVWAHRGLVSGTPYSTPFIRESICDHVWDHKSNFNFLPCVWISATMFPFQNSFPPFPPFSPSSTNYFPFENISHLLLCSPPPFLFLPPFNSSEQKIKVPLAKLSTPCGLVCALVDAHLFQGSSSGASKAKGWKLGRQVMMLFLLGDFKVSRF